MGLAVGAYSSFWDFEPPYHGSGHIPRALRGLWGQSFADRTSSLLLSRATSLLSHYIAVVCLGDCSCELKCELIAHVFNAASIVYMQRNYFCVA